LLNHAYGFAGAPNVDALSSQPLSAPQATLITTLAKGVIGGDLRWDLILMGAAIGLGLVLINFVLKKSSNDKYSLPPLGVGLAIYLPSAVTLPVVIGAFAGWYFERTVSKHSWGESAKRLGVLIMSGFIVGESLFNVALAGLIVFTEKGEPLAIPNTLSASQTMVIALVIGSAVVVGLYMWAAKRGRAAA